MRRGRPVCECSRRTADQMKVTIKCGGTNFLIAPLISVKVKILVIIHLGCLVFLCYGELPPKRLTGRDLNPKFRRQAKAHSSVIDCRVFVHTESKRGVTSRGVTQVTSSELWVLAK